MISKPVIGCADRGQLKAGPDHHGDQWRPRPAPPPLVLPPPPLLPPKPEEERLEEDRELPPPKEDLDEELLPKEDLEEDEPPKREPEDLDDQPEETLGPPPKGASWYTVRVGRYPKPLGRGGGGGMMAARRRARLPLLMITIRKMISSMKRMAPRPIPKSSSSS